MKAPNIVPPEMRFLDNEIALRKQIEAVAAKRRSLPLGGKVPEDCVFERIGKTSMPENVKMS
jgi:predicted dithiol-disulfide oxidoreductase (DUF899 family)